MFSGIDSSPEIVKNLNLEQQEYLEKSLCLAYFNQPLTNSVTFTKFFYLQEESDWKMEGTKRVSVQHDKLVDCFALRDEKMLLLFSATAIILDKNFREVNSIKFKNKLV